MAAPSAGPILHVDMDAFYASVEQRDDVRLQGLPVVVGGSRNRGVVAACSYEARVFGIRSAMPTSEAHRRCPRAVFLPPDFARYTAESRAVMRILQEFAPAVEPLSLDEAFLDLSGTELLGDGATAGARIRARIRAERGLPASVGIASNRFLAKLATELAKPDGLRVIAKGQEREVVYPLPLERLWGVGPKTAAKLRGLGLRSIGEVMAHPAAALPAGFVEPRQRLQARIDGEPDDPAELQPRRSCRSMERTFEHDIADPRRLERELLRYAEHVTLDLRRRGLVGRGVRLKIRYGDFRTSSRSAVLDEPTQLPGPVHAAALRLLRQAPLEAPVRLLGLSVDDLRDLLTQTVQGELFPDPPRSTRAREARLTASLDRIRDRHGDGSIVPGRLLE